MRKLLPGITVVLTILFILVCGAFSTVQAAETPEKILTEQQKHEMEMLQKEVLELKKEVVDKYVEYGILSELQGKKMRNYFDRRYKKLEQNGFIPPTKRKKSNKK